MPAGNFFARVDILPGRNTFDITAMDAYGQSAGTTLTLEGTQTAGRQRRSAVRRLAQLRRRLRPHVVRRAEQAALRRTGHPQRGRVRRRQPVLRRRAQHQRPDRHRPRRRRARRPTASPTTTSRPPCPAIRSTPAEITGFVNAVFHNPNRVPFTYELVFLAKLNDPPAFTTTPVVETYAGRTYTYDADATDPDGDTLTYSLVTGPAEHARSTRPPAQSPGCPPWTTSASTPSPSASPTAAAARPNNATCSPSPKPRPTARR